MSTLSKVKSVQQNGDWENKHGDTMYKHEYEMEDGVVFQANHKSQNPFAIGDEVEYTITKDDPEYGKSGKVAKPGSSNYSGSNGSKGSNASYSLSYAKDVLVASYVTPKGDVLALSTEQMFDLAEKMNNWLNDH